MGEYGSLGIFLLVALFFPVMALGPAFLLQPKKPSPQKYINYDRVALRPVSGGVFPLRAAVHRL